MFEAEITQREGERAEGKVRTNGIAVVAKRVGFAEWEALYAIGRDGENVDLPSCFALNGEAVKALEEALKEIA